MRHEITHGPAFTILTLHLDEGELVRAQPDSMVGMTSTFQVTAEMGSQIGGTSSALGKGLRGLMSGESFFTACFRAKKPESNIVLARPEVGDILGLPVGPEHTPWYLTAGAFLACPESVKLELKWAGIKGLLATRGLYFMKPEGEGQVFLASHGALVEKELAEGERYVLDNRYVVAFQAHMPYESVTLTKSLKHAYFSGEGFVMRFTGPGKILFQTRARQSTGFFRSMLSMAPGL
jgi:uncharacterized protein (TIGR00266 family)